MSTPDALWYREGLAFTCTRCGACCTGAPGYVWVNEEQIEALSQFLGESIAEFTRRYVRRVGPRLSLVERPNGDCVFWDREAGCTVYPARPVQCRTWPFWPENIESPEDWRDTTHGCPGADKGRWHSLEEIREAAARTRENRS
jgi:Fe-S-cluster containining protein